MSITEVKRGRPSSYTQTMADMICAQLSDGLSLRTVCRPANMPDKTTVWRWIREREDFRGQYARAKQEAADALADEILDIADDSTNDWMTVRRKDGTEYEVVNNEVVQRSRLRIDTRRWLMAKMKPKVYGEKIDHTTNGKDLPTPILGAVSVRSDDSNP